MKTFLKAALVTAAILSTASVANAQPVELVTGIGFGDSRLEATTNASRAWIRQAMNDYPGMNVSLSTAGVRMSCEEVGSSGGATTLGTDFEGNPNGSWICQIRGVPF